MVDRIYPTELQLNRANSYDTEASFLDLNLCISNGVQFIVFLTLSTLICRGTDISKCFNVSLGIRDNESRLYTVRLCDKQICSR